MVQGGFKEVKHINDLRYSTQVNTSMLDLHLTVCNTILLAGSWDLIRPQERT